MMTPPSIDPSLNDRLLPLGPEPLPLREEADGTLRVSNSRITLDLIVEQYENGMSPESMVKAYDTLKLADVHAVIAYYLRHRDQVRAYLAHRRELAEKLRQRIESRHPGIRGEELLAHRAVQEKNHASADR